MAWWDRSPTANAPTSSPRPQARPRPDISDMRATTAESRRDRDGGDGFDNAVSVPQAPRAPKPSAPRPAPTRPAQQPAAPSGPTPEQLEEQRRQRFRDERGDLRRSFIDDILEGLRIGGLDDASAYTDDINRDVDHAFDGYTYANRDNRPDVNVDELVADILGRETDMLRSGYTRQVNEFAPEGFEYDMLGDDMADPITRAILQEQYDPALEYLTRARDRGQLNPRGFDAGMDALTGQRTAGDARIGDIVSGILTGGRETLSGIADNARKGAGTASLLSSFDPSVYRNRINTEADRFRRDFEGNVRNTIGGEQFFDLDQLVQLGGNAQGAVNLVRNQTPLLGAFEQRRRDEETSRGLGSQGSF